MPVHTLSCSQNQSNLHPADIISTENTEIQQLSAYERQLSIEPIGLVDNLSWENYSVERETYQEIVFLSQPTTTTANSTVKEDDLLEAVILEEDNRQLVDESFLEELFDYPATYTSEIRQGELNTPVIGK